MSKYKKINIFLDFDCVLNNFDREEKSRYEKIEFNKENVNNLYILLKYLERKYGDNCYKIILNTAWKMNTGIKLIGLCKLKAKASKDCDKELDYIVNKFEDVTPTYNFFNRNKEGGTYCCKSFEVLSYIAQNYNNEDNDLFLYLDDEKVEFEYINVIQYNTNIHKGLTFDDIRNIKNIIDKNILKTK